MRRSDEKVVRRSVEKIMLRWQHLVLAEAYSSWNDHVKEKELLQKEAGLEEMALRMRNAGMLKVLASWLKNAKELRHQKSLLNKMSLRMTMLC